MNTKGICVVILILFSMALLYSKSNGAIEDCKLIENNYNGKKFYWKNKGIGYFNFGKKSIIEFRNDSVIVSTFPHNPAGAMSLKIGHLYSNTNSSILCIEFDKILMISLNTGQVIRYYEKCGSQIDLEIKEEGLVREVTKYNFPFREEGQRLKKGKITYEAINDYNPDLFEITCSGYDYFYRYIKFENQNKLKGCNSF